MIQFFILLIINSLACVGLFKSFQFEWALGHDNDGKETIEPDDPSKGVFWFWKFYVLDKIPYRLSKPLGNCLTCMGSVYSFLPYWYYKAWDFGNIEAWAFYPFYIFALAGLNSFFNSFVNE